MKLALLIYEDFFDPHSGEMLLDWCEVETANVFTEKEQWEKVAEWRLKYWLQHRTYKIEYVLQSKMNADV